MSVVEDLPQEGVRAPVDITWDSWLQGVNTPNLSLGPSLSLSDRVVGYTPLAPCHILLFARLCMCAPCLLHCLSIYMSVDVFVKKRGEPEMCWSEKQQQCLPHVLLHSPTTLHFSCRQDARIMGLQQTRTRTHAHKKETKREQERGERNKKTGKKRDAAPGVEKEIVNS